jgi:hypothetical protein
MQSFVNSVYPGDILEVASKQKNFFTVYETDRYVNWYVRVSPSGERKEAESS